MTAQIVTRKCEDPFDVSRTANTLIEQHGRYAALVAARWADCAARAGNHDRASAWRQIVDAVTCHAPLNMRPTPTCQVFSAQSRAA